MYLVLHVSMEGGGGKGDMYLVLHVSMEGGGVRVTCTLYFMSVWRVGG